MRYLILTGDESDDDLKAAILNLRHEQQRQVIASTEREYAADVDELIDLLTERTASWH